VDLGREQWAPCAIGASLSFLAGIGKSTSVKAKANLGVVAQERTQALQLVVNERIKRVHHQHAHPWRRQGGIAQHGIDCWQ
jgi:hypothetical protein